MKKMNWKNNETDNIKQYDRKSQCTRELQQRKKTYIATSFRNQTKQKKRSSDPYCMLAIFLHWKITYIINKQNEHRQQT